MGEHGPYSVSSATAVEFNWQSGLWDFDGVCGDSLVPRAGGRRSAGYLQTGELGVFHGASFRFSFLSRGAMCEFGMCEFLECPAFFFSSPFFFLFFFLLFLYKKGEQDTCFVGGSGHHELHEMFMIIASNIEDAQHILTLFKRLKLNAIPQYLTASMRWRSEAVTRDDDIDN